MGNIYVGDTGTVLELVVHDHATGFVIDVSEATLKQFKLRKPDGTVITRSASFSGDGSDGKLRYVTLAADLDQTGSWTLQSYLELPTGKWHSSESTFTVKAHLG